MPGHYFSADLLPLFFSSYVLAFDPRQSAHRESVSTALAE
jgi:hypothetical protein